MKRLGIHHHHHPAAMFISPDSEAFCLQPLVWRPGPSPSCQHLIVINCGHPKTFLYPESSVLSPCHPHPHRDVASSTTVSMQSTYPWALRWLESSGSDIVPLEDLALHVLPLGSKRLRRMFVCMGGRPPCSEGPAMATGGEDRRVEWPIKLGGAASGTRHTRAFQDCILLSFSKNV